VTQESANFYATNFELGSISPLFIHQCSRSRWRIDFPQEEILRCVGVRTLEAVGTLSGVTVGVSSWARS
jgi:hypothetical protein